MKTRKVISLAWYHAKLKRGHWGRWVARQHPTRQPPVRRTKEESSWAADGEAILRIRRKPPAITE
jgi:hypothetical protein